MADKRTGSEAPGGRRRKRAAPTIELTASDVSAPEAKAAQEPQTAPQTEPQVEPSPAEAAAPPAAEPTPPEPPPEAATQEPPVEPEPESVAEAAPEPSRTAAPYLAALAGGIVGAVIVAGVAAALWYGGLLPSAGDNGQAAQIAALQSKVQALQNRPPPAPDTKAIDALQARVNKLASDIAKSPPTDKTVTERLAAADNALKSFGIALTALNHRNDDIAADAKQARERAAAAEKTANDLRASLQNVAKDASGAIPAAALTALQKQVAALHDNLQTRMSALDGLQKQVAGLAQTMKDARSAIAQNTATNKDARLALSAVALRDAVVSGQPYAAELAQAKAFGADKEMLAPLNRFAQQGVPSRAALAHELSALIPAMQKASGHKAAPAGFLDRLQANASRLVRIEPATAPQGDAPSDVLARIKLAAAKGDINGALADLAKLPPAVRAPAQDWIAKATARGQALAAARHFAAATARALGKS